LHGADTFRSRQKVKEIIASYEKAHLEKVRSFYFDCKEVSIEYVKSALATGSLFEKKKLIIVENVFQNNQCVEWLEAEKEHFKISENNVVVVFEREEIKAKTKNKLYQWLRKNAKQQEFSLLSSANVKLWIAKEFQKYGLQIMPRAQEFLARSAENDLWKLSNDIRKIATFKWSEGVTQIKEGDVMLFVEGHMEADIFRTIDEVSQRNKKQAFNLLYRHLKKKEAAPYLFSMFVYQFRTLLQIRELAEQNFSRQQIAYETKLHPYVLQKGMQVAEKFSLRELMDIYRKLFELERSSKTGKINSEAALDMFVATV